jgi:putative glutamine amidotransferase
MTPAIGITCSTIVLGDMAGVSRFAIPAYYAECVEEAGGLPVILPNLKAESAAAHLARVDGLVLSGGVDIDPFRYGQEPMPDLGKVDQVRDAFEIELVRGARAAGTPVLAICRGIQVMNVAFGGTLLQHIPKQVKNPSRHDQKTIQPDADAHGLRIEPGTRLHAIAGVEETRVNTFHHQAVDRVADGFVVSARALDGVVEGIEDPDHPHLVGVQWHPERRPADELTRKLFASVVEAARQAARSGAR